VLADAAATASAYIYLVSAFGKSGGGTPIDGVAVATAIDRLRGLGARVPIAVGFGIRTAADIVAVHRLGADAAIVGSALVSRVEHALSAGRDVTVELAAFVDALRPGLELAVASRSPSGANPTTPTTHPSKEIDP
jgi:tryptophan synthase alpha chain